jgi:hypothetical protein
MKKLSNTLLIGVALILSPFNLAHSKADKSLLKAEEQGKTVKSQLTKYYLGGATVISKDNLILQREKRLLQRVYDTKNNKLIENVAVFDNNGFGVSAYTEAKKVDSIVQSNLQSVFYSTVSNNDGGKIKGVDLEMIEGLFSEFRIYDPKGNFTMAFFRWNSEITESEYHEKLSEIKWKKNLNLRTPASQFK